MTRLRRLLPVIAMTAAMTAALAACTSTDSGNGNGNDAGGSEAADVAAEAESAPEGADGAGTGRARPDVQLDRAVISTGTVSLVADDVAEARREVQRVVDAARGQVSEEDTESDADGSAVYARLVLRVPADDFDEAMTALEGVAKLRTSHRSEEDVTGEVIDTDARLRAQRASLERVETLFARAERLQQIVWIEGQLTQRQADLDSLRQRQAWLADQTSLSTITVDIERTPDDATEEETDETGFVAGLTGGLSALGATVTALVTVLGAVLPFAVLLATLGIPVWLVRRGARRRRAAAQA